MEHYFSKGCMENWTLNLLWYKHILCTNSGPITVNMLPMFLKGTVALRFMWICRLRSMHSQALHFTFVIGGRYIQYFVILLESSENELYCHALIDLRYLINFLYYNPIFKCRKWKLTEWIRVSLEELLLTQIVRNVQNISNLGSTLPYSRGPATSIHREADTFCHIYLPYVPE
jgi:hypothetical protein